MLFYVPVIEGGFAQLDEEESRHLTTVLRRKAGDRLHLTDGKGCFYTAEIVEAAKRSTHLRILEQTTVPSRAARLHIAIAPTKNMDRLEWFVEKAVEIGVEQITPLLCQRSERVNLRLDRLEKVAVSAMKQSLHAYLPVVGPLTPFPQLVQAATETKRLIAWCPPEAPPHLKSALQPMGDTLVLIGPEGDFTKEEVTLAQEQGFAGISLGEARLRTETAGVFVAAAFALG